MDRAKSTPKPALAGGRLSPAKAGSGKNGTVTQGSTRSTLGYILPPALLAHCVIYSAIALAQIRIQLLEIFTGSLSAGNFRASAGAGR
ncbi:MAG: hypothetical protein QOH71_952 [Blastocatellia bacterium]|nr:hypothetical protein [Blastocatellia bacterium]